MNPLSRFALLGLTITLGACSVLQGDKIDYKSAAVKTPSLEVPPDLTQLSKDSRYNVPGAAVTASGYQVGRPTRQPCPRPQPVWGTFVLNARAHNAGW